MEEDITRIVLELHYLVQIIHPSTVDNASTCIPPVDHDNVTNHIFLSMSGYLVYHA